MTKLSDEALKAAVVLYEEDGLDFSEPTIVFPRRDGCKVCGDTRTVRVHGAEDYGVSFESEMCEECAPRWIALADYMARVREQERATTIAEIETFLRERASEHTMVSAHFAAMALSDVADVLTIIRDILAD